MVKETDPIAREMCIFWDEQAVAMQGKTFHVELDIPQDLWGIGRGPSSYPVTFEFMEKSDEKQRFLNQGTGGAAARFPMSRHVLERGTFLGTAKNMRRYFARSAVSFEDRVKQFTETVAEREAIKTRQETRKTKLETQRKSSSEKGACSS